MQGLKYIISHASHRGEACFLYTIYTVLGATGMGRSTNIILPNSTVNPYQKKEKR